MKKEKRMFGIFTAMILVLNCCFGIAGYAADGSVAVAEFAYVNTDTSKEYTALSSGSADAGYLATGGMMKDSTRLFGSVDGVSFSTIVWSEVDFKCADGTKKSVPGIVPNDDNTWGKTPYFLVKTSTKGYENITFTAGVSGSKKGPRDYKLQYSTDGTNYTDVTGTNTIAVHKNLTTKLFDNISVSGADDKDTVYFKIIATSTKSINGTDDFYSLATSGEAEIYDILISGTAVSEKVPKLPAPTADTANGSDICSHDSIAFSSNISGALIKYSINGGAETVYEKPFKPFKGNQLSAVTITAWAELEGYETSDITTVTYTCTRDNIAEFKIDDLNDVEYINGSLKPDDCVYESSRLSASLDGESRYVPLYNDEKGPSVSIAPDDTYVWKKGCYWQFEISTAGYDEVYLSMDAFSSKKGPASMSLKYSTDGETFTTVEANRVLSVSQFGKYFDNFKLPSQTADKEKVYIRLVAEEDKRADLTDSSPLFDNESKGNTYINNVSFTGTRTSKLKMPDTSKKTSFFGRNGSIEYTSADGAQMRYSIYDKYNNTVADNVIYDNETGISLANTSVFDPSANNEFRVDIWAQSGSDSSKVNSKIYTYKGDYIADFEFDESTSFGSSVAATVGNAVLSMYPNGSTQKELVYNAASGTARASAETDNPWSFDTERTNTENDGYWLIELSTKGYKDITFSAQQVSTEKGPRDFCLSYSTDGITYKDINDSNVRLTDNLEAVYSNVRLPEEADNADKVYLKIKIDGGETVSGVELTSDTDDLKTAVDEDVYGKGHTGINYIELCGIPIENKLITDTADETLLKGKEYKVYYAAKSDEAVTVIAYYNANGLVNCTIGSGVIRIPETSDITEVKVMLWESPTSLKPLTAGIHKSVQ